MTIKLSRERINQIRHEARETCAALLMVQLVDIPDTELSEQFVSITDVAPLEWTDEETAEFRAEIERVIPQDPTMIDLLLTIALLISLVGQVYLHKAVHAVHNALEQLIEISAMHNDAIEELQDQHR